jgi:pyrroloquinoline quinone biosynthesis protein E
VRDHSLRAIWRSNPAFKAFRGMVRRTDPCRSCNPREVGCRCQALPLTGNPRNTDFACDKSPHHERITAMARKEIRSVPFNQAGGGNVVNLSQTNFCK